LQARCQRSRRFLHRSPVAAEEGVGPAQTADPDPEAEAGHTHGLVSAMVEAKVHYGHKVRQHRISSST